MTRSEKWILASIVTVLILVIVLAALPGDSVEIFSPGPGSPRRLQVVEKSFPFHAVILFLLPPVISVAIIAAVWGKRGAGFGILTLFICLLLCAGVYAALIMLLPDWLPVQIVSSLWLT